MRKHWIACAIVLAVALCSGQARSQLYMDYNSGNVITCTDASGTPIAASGGNINNLLQSMTFDAFANQTSCYEAIYIYCVDSVTFETSLLASDECGPNESGTGSWPLACGTGDFIALVISSSCGGGQVVVWY